MTYTPIHGCAMCGSSGGVMCCPYHGPTARSTAQPVFTPHGAGIYECPDCGDATFNIAKHKQFCPKESPVVWKQCAHGYVGGCPMCGGGDEL